MNKICIIGLGWLGLPLAHSLVNKGYEVSGSIRDESKLDVIKSKTINIFLLNIRNGDIEYSIPDLNIFDTYIINIPPNYRDKENYSDNISSLLNDISFDKKIIFISSTSVYTGNNGEIDDETMPVADSLRAKQILNTEKLITKYKKFSIIRFGGLIGMGRNPANFFNSSKAINQAGQFVNMIHLDDCIGVISLILEKLDSDNYNYTINACMPQRRTKKEFYSIANKLLSKSVPNFSDERDYLQKKINPKYLIENLKYNFEFKDPIDALKFGTYS